MNASATTPALQEMRRTFECAMDIVAEEAPDPVSLQVIEGSLPASLRGVLLRNGPGRQQRGGVRYGHPFDGDGYLQRLAFEGNRVTWCARYVRTREFIAEQAADRILYRGFGTNKPGGLLANAGRLRFKNAANTSVVQHAGRTLALWEGGLPHQVDPETLRTVGRYDFDGALRNTRSRIDAWLNPELPFAAHPTVDAATGECWSFGTAFGRENLLLVHTVDASGHLRTREIRTGDLPFVHDMALTRRFAIFVLPAVVFDVPRALLGLSTPVASLTTRDAPGTALIVPRDGGPIQRIPVEPGFVFHWAGAWEEGDDRIVLEGVKYDGFPEFDGFDSMFGPDGAPGLLAHPVRITLDLERSTATEQRLDDVAMELPSAVGTGRGRVIYGTAAPPSRRQPFLSALARLDDHDVRLRDFFPDLPGEPLRCGDFLVAPLYRRDAPSEILVLEPEDLSTVARLALPSPVPPQLHGIWLD